MHETAPNTVCGLSRGLTVDCHLLPLYSREGRHLSDRYLQRLASPTQRIEIDEQHNTCNKKYILLIWGWTVPLTWETNLIILLIRKHYSFYRRLIDDIFLPFILRTGLLVSLHKGVLHMKPGNILLSSPAHEPPSGLSSVPAAHGHKHLGSVSSGKPSPAPPAGSWWTWCDCVSSCPCCSQPHSCPEGWRDPSPAARSAPSRQVLSGSGSCLPSQQGRRSGASQTPSGHCCLFLWVWDKERGRKKCGQFWLIVHCSFELAPHQFDSVNVSANNIYDKIWTC